MARTRKLTWALVTAGLLALWALLYAVGHSAYVADVLKAKIVGRVQEELRQRIEVGEVALNFIPLSVEFRDVSMRDGKGSEWARVRRLKAYPDPLDLVRSKVTLDRVALSGAELRLNDETMPLIAGLVRPKGGGTPGSVEVRTIDLSKGVIVYDGQGVHAEGRNITLTAVLRDDPEIMFRVPEISFLAGSVAGSSLSARGTVIVGRQTIQIDSLALAAGRSSLQMKGSYTPWSRSLKTTLGVTLDIEEMSRLFNLRTVKAGRVSATGQIVYKDKAVSAELRLSGDFFLESLMAALSLDEPVAGHTRFNGKVTVQSGDVRGSATAELSKGSLYGIAVDKGTVLVSYDGKTLMFSKGKAIGYGGTADVEVSLAMPGVESFMIDVSARRLSAGPLLRQYGLDLPVAEGWVSGRIRSEGAQFRPQGSFTAEFTPRIGPVTQRLTAASGAFTSEGRTLVIRNGRISTEVSDAGVEGNVDVLDGSLSLRATVKSRDLADLTGPFVTDLGGHGSGVFFVAGTIADPVIRGMITLHEARYRTVALGDVNADFEYRRELLTVRDLELKREDSIHSARGTIAFPHAHRPFDIARPEFGLEGAVTNLGAEEVLKLAGLPVPLKGRMTAAVRVSGPQEALVAHADISMDGASLYGYSLDQITARADYAKRTFAVPELVLKRNGSSVELEGAIGLDGSYEVRTRKAVLKPEDIPSGHNLQKGSIELKAGGKGTFRHPALQARLTADGVMVRGAFPIGRSVLDLALDGDRLTCTGTLANGLSDVRGAVTLSAGLPWDLRVAFKRGVYDFILGMALKEYPDDLMLSLEGGAELSGDRDSVRGTVLLTGFNMSLYGFSVSNAADVRVNISNSLITLEQLTLRSGYATFSAAGSFVPMKSMNITIQGVASLTPLQRMFRNIEAIKGNGSFVFSLVGPWDDPVINGSVNLKNASIGIKGLPYRIIDITSYIYIDDNRVVIESLSGKMGGGDIGIKGYGFVKSFRIQRFYLDALLDDVTLKLDRGFSVNVDGSLIFKGEGEQSSMVGQILVNKGRYTQRVDWKTMLLKSRTAERPKGKLSPLQETELNIKISSSDDIVIENNVAKANLRIDLLLRGTLASPLVYGRVESLKGAVYFRNHQFEIIHGSADFVDPAKIDPYFDITAKTTVSGYAIRIAIEGQMQRFDLSLSSDPPLDETDILSLLTVGEFGPKVKGMEAGIGTAEATSFLTGKYQDVLEERLTMITGFDRFLVEPYVSEKKGIVPRVTVSKRLIGDKLYITYSSTVGVPDANVVKLEYQLDKNVTLVGDVDERGTYGADIKFRFEFK